MSRRNNRQKMEEKPMDYLDEFTTVSTEIPQIISEKKYKIKVDHPALRVRQAPNLQAEVVDVIRDEGYYDILDEVNGWGMIDENKWIMLSYTHIIDD